MSERQNQQAEVTAVEQDPEALRRVIDAVRTIHMDRPEHEMNAVAEAIVSGEISYSDGIQFLIEGWEDDHPPPDKNEWEKAAETAMVRRGDRWVWTDLDPEEKWERTRSNVESRIEAHLDHLVERLDAAVPGVSQEERDAARLGATTPVVLQTDLQQEHDRGMEYE